MSDGSAVQRPDTDGALNPLITSRPCTKHVGLYTSQCLQRQKLCPGETSLGVTEVKPSDPKGVIREYERAQRKPYKDLTSKESMLAAATPDHSWQAPGPNDLRSPCPGLNTLANHGYLPRNGQNITISMILQAAFDGYHISDALTLPAKVGMMTSPEPETLNLDDLKLHGVIEHDASVSRADFALGDNLHFNETIFETMVNANPGSNVYNVTSAGQVLQARLADSLARNPNVTNSETEFTNRILEGATYLSVMGDPSTGVAPKNFVQIFFREERLPIEEGWKRSSSPITLASLLQLANRIAQESHWSATDECPTNPVANA